MFYQWRNKRCRPHIRCPIIYQSVIDPDLNPRTPHWLFSFFIFNWVCLLKSVMVNTVLGAMDSKKKNAMLPACNLPSGYKNNARLSKQQTLQNDDNHTNLYSTDPKCSRDLEEEKSQLTSKARWMWTGPQSFFLSIFIEIPYFRGTNL